MKYMCFAFAFITWIVPVSAAAAADGKVTTIAGSGQSGYRDGPALQATFMEPVSLAYGKDGALYIADRAAQRIRMLRDGNVFTIAGSGGVADPGLEVEGGFRNGPGSQARFSDPSAVAVGPDGNIYVADTMNHCIRVIRGGTVYTYAGQPQVAGQDDGPALLATFRLPDALGFDVAGNLFVADNGVGIREIASGHVSTIALPADIQHDVTSVAPVSNGLDERLILVNRDGIYSYQLSNGTTAFYAAGGVRPRDNNIPSHVFVDGYRSIGYPFSLAVLGTLDFVYTDLWMNSVRVIHGNFTHALTGEPNENTSATSGAFRDGPSGRSAFNTPMGIAVRPGVGFAVADAGNRRIRMVPADNPEQAAGVTDLPSFANYYRMVLVGSSLVLWNTDREHSVAGLIEARLQSNWKAYGFPRKPRVLTMRLFAGTYGIASFIQQYLSQGLAEGVIWEFNSAAVVEGSGRGLGTDLGSDTGWWLPNTEKVLATTGQMLAEQHVYFLPVLTPQPWEVSPVESTWWRIFAMREPSYVNPDTQTYGSEHGALLAALNAANVPVLDLWPVFRQTEEAPEHRELFTTRDNHPSEAGNALIANEIVKQLLRAHPWRK